MSRKRRFKRKTLGRLHMFFGKKPYTGYRGSVQVKQYSTHMELIETHTPGEVHYKNVTKKKIHYPHNAVC